MNRIVFQILKAKTPPRMSCQQKWAPPCDVFETAAEVIVNLEVPGVKPKDLQVIWKDNILRIRGRRKDENNAAKLNYYQMEIHYGDFEKVVVLPANVAGGKFKSAYKDGFLQIVLPKTGPKK
jgi:HSP20 family protein